MLEAENRRKDFDNSRDSILEKKNQVMDDLLAQYGDHGPQYQLLVDLAASTKTRMDMLLTASKEDNTQYLELARMFVQTINQLQKYTEASRSISESVSRELNEVMNLVMMVVSRELEHEPSTFKRIMLSVRKMVEDAMGNRALLGTPTVEDASSEVAA